MKSYRTIFAILALASVVKITAAQESRIWQSVNGNSVEAVFSSYDPKSKQVQLQTSDGDTVTVDLAYLSSSDQRFIKRVARKKSKTTLPDLEVQETNKKKRPAMRRQGKGKQGRLFGINWTLDLEGALKVAKGNASSSDDRPVMWLRVLGDLNGFM